MHFYLWALLRGYPFTGNNFFMTLSCAYLRCDGPSYLVNMLNKIEITNKQLQNFLYQWLFGHLNGKPVLVARLFQYKVF